MVERKFNSRQREIFNLSPTSNIDKLRCIITRLGSELSQPDNRGGGGGGMVRGGIKVSHKCLGAIKGKECNINSHPHGQHYSPVIFNENGVYQKPGVDCDQQRNLAIPFETRDDDYCRILTRVNECRFRESRQTRDSSEWKLNSTIFMKLCQIRGTPEMDVCLEGVTPITPVHAMENRPFKQGRDAFQISWAHDLCMLFSLLHS